MMKDYYERSMRALQLAGMSEPTQKGYTRSVRMLVDFFTKKHQIRSANKNYRTTSCTAKTLINGPPLPCGFAIAE